MAAALFTFVASDTMLFSMPNVCNVRTTPGRSAKDAPSPSTFDNAMQSADKPSRCQFSFRVENRIQRYSSLANAGFLSPSTVASSYQLAIEVLLASGSMAATCA
jgi:hypothetical protein